MLEDIVKKSRIARPMSAKSTLVKSNRPQNKLAEIAQVNTAPIEEEDEFHDHDHIDLKEPSTH